MGKYNLIIFPTAKQDLLDIIEFLNMLSHDTALKKYDAIIDKIGSLSEMPKRCPLLKTAELRSKGYRALIVDNYMVFYVVKGNNAEIRRILYGRRQYEFLL